MKFWVFPNGLLLRVHGRLLEGQLEQGIAVLD